jgi:hypothetical protein
VLKTKETNVLGRALSVALALLLINAGAATALAKSAAEKEAARAAKVRQAIVKLGTGEAARVKLELRDGAKFVGYVTAAGEDSFTVADARTGVATIVPYPQVKKVSGNNLSTGAKVAIGVGIVAAVVIILWAVADKDFTN